MKYPDAGINPAKSGLTARAGLYFKAGLHDKGDGFNLQDLDPYLLFDAETSMLGNLENPTLDLDPATPDTLDVITATRAGIATYTAADGQIVVANENTVRVDHVQGEELTPTKFQRFVNTEFDQSYWNFSSQMGQPVYNYAIAPNGEQEATRIVSNGGSYPQLLEVIEGLTVGQQYTVSFYVKSDGTSQIQQFTHFTGLSGIPFTPTDNWERISYTVTATATSHTFVIFTNGASAPASSYLIWGPQLEEGTSATDFVPNTTGSPKFIASATYGPRVPMMLIEPSATNDIAYSEDFSQWSTFGDATIEATNILSPSGQYNATTISGLNGNGNNDLRYSISTNPANTTYSFSVYLKGQGTLRLHLSNNVDQGFSEQVNLSSEWQRFDFTVTFNSTTTSVLNVVIDDSGGQTATSYDVWGAQLEEGSVATSYIPTSGSVAERTRNADNLVIDGTNFSDFYNATEGTFYIEAVHRTPTIRCGYLSGQSSNQLFLYQNNGDDSIVMFDGATSKYIANTPANELFRAAVTYNATERQLSLNGVDSSVGTHNGNWGLATELNVGQGPHSIYPAMSGYLKRVLYWPTHSSSL